MYSLDGLRVDLDSSNGNAPEGKSHGGFAMFMPGGGGAIAAKVVTPEKVTDSSGGAELVLTTIGLKYTIGLLMLFADLRRGGVPIAVPPPQVPFRVDASAVIDGTVAERITKETRWMASRKAMLRSALSRGVIAFHKVSAEDNVADILTKSLTGPAFERHRAAILGLVLLSEATRAFLPAVVVCVP